MFLVGAVRLFPVLLALMRTALIRGFPNSFAMKARAGPYGPYDQKQALFINFSQCDWFISRN